MSKAPEDKRLILRPASTQVGRDLRIAPILPPNGGQGLNMKWKALEKVGSRRSRVAGESWSDA
jgi:hypothetical protein